MRINCVPQLLCSVFLLLWLLPAQNVLASDEQQSDTATGLTTDTAPATTADTTTDTQVDTERKSVGLQGRPQWEFGVGGGYFEGFDYPGSTDRNRRGFGLPFFIFRSKRFRFGGGGVSAVTIEKPRWKLDWSVAASLNSSNEEGSARQGMENLDFLIELGPQIIWRAVDVVGAGGEEYRMDWSTKLRGVVSTDFGSVQARGAVFESTLAGRIRNIAGLKRFALFGAISARAGSERLNDYFYEVPEEFVTPTREAFDGKAGLIDLRTTVGVGMSLPRRVRIFVSVSTGFYGNAANRDSPLHLAKRSASTAIGLVWTIKQSQKRVGILDTQ